MNTNSKNKTTEKIMLTIRAARFTFELWTDRGELKIMKIEATAAVEHNVKRALKYVKYRHSECSIVLTIFNYFTLYVLGF